MSIAPGAGPLPAGRSVAVWALLFLLALPLAVALAMGQALSHDEHQHVAAGALVAREGLLPYRDFPCFHTPFLAVIYGWLFKGADSLLLTARLFTALCVALVAALTGGEVARVMRERGARHPLGLGAGAVLLVLTANVFAENAGGAWNHEPALLAALASFLVFARAVRQVKPGWAFAAGLLLGIAIGIRLTYAPLVAAWIGAVFLHPAGRQRWLMLLSWLAGGLAVCLGVLIWFFVQAPAQMLFGVWEFAQVNVLYRFSTGEPRTMTLPKKLRFLVKLVIRPDLALFLVWLGPLVALALAFRRRIWAECPFELRFVLLTFPFLLMGALAPSPTFEQYYLPFVPFMVMGAAYAWAALPETIPWAGTFSRALLGVAVASMIFGVRNYRELPELVQMRNWGPVKVHALGVALQGRLRGQAGRVLTLSPIIALEAGASIYPALSTGPFAWRVAPFVSAEKAAKLKLLSAGNLAETLAAEPPRAVLVGDSERWEKPLEQWAKEAGWRSEKLGKELRLWQPKPVK